MVRSTISASTLATVLAIASSASAEPLDQFGARGQFIISADRLSPLFSYTRVKQDQGGGDTTTTSTTSISLLWTGEPQDFYDIPRLGLDYVIAPSITVGGSLFATLPLSASRSTTNNGVTTSRDGAKTTFVGVGARAGYVLPLSHGISFWPRGGLSYSRESITNPITQQDNQTSTSVSQFALSLEPIFVIEPTPHFGVMLGPVLDLPLSGTQHSEFTNGPMTVSTDTDTSQLHFGITAGILGWL